MDADALSSFQQNYQAPQRPQSSHSMRSDLSTMSSASAMQRRYNQQKNNIFSYTRQQQQPLAIIEEGLPPRPQAQGGVPLTEEEELLLQQQRNMIGAGASPNRYQSDLSPISPQQGYGRRQASDLTAARPGTSRDGMSRSPSGATLLPPRGMSTRGSPSRGLMGSRMGPGGIPPSRAGGRPGTVVVPEGMSMKQVTPTKNMWKGYVDPKNKVAAPAPAPVFDLSYDSSTRQQALHNRKLFLDHAAAQRAVDPTLDQKLIEQKVTHKHSVGTSLAMQEQKLRQKAASEIRPEEKALYEVKQSVENKRMNQKIVNQHMYGPGQVAIRHEVVEVQNRRNLKEERDFERQAIAMMNDKKNMSVGAMRRNGHRSNVNLGGSALKGSAHELAVDPYLIG